MSGATVRARFRPQRRGMGPVAAHKPSSVRQKASQGSPSRVAQMLALAHHIERLVDAGELPGGYADAARALGLTRARLTQVMNLALLAPEIQERLLTDKLGASERRLRGLSSIADWAHQAEAIAQGETSGKTRCLQ